MSKQAFQVLSVVLFARVDAGEHPFLRRANMAEVAPVPSWCENIPAVARADVPPCGGVATARGTGTVPSWCSDVPPEHQHYIPECLATGVQLLAHVDNATSLPSGAIGEHVMLTAASVSSTVPSWCNDIPDSGRKYVPSCDNSADGSSGDAGSDTADPNTASSAQGNPSWCNDIPVDQWQHVPNCRPSGDTSSSAISGSVPVVSRRGAAVVAIAVLLAGLFCGTV